MRVWHIRVRPNHEGVALADTEEDALALADHPDSYALPSTRIRLGRKTGEQPASVGRRDDSLQKAHVMRRRDGIVGAGLIIVGIVVVVLTVAQIEGGAWRATVVERGTAHYCEKTGEWAYKGGCPE